jgi:hypothetical protein
MGNGMIDLTPNAKWTPECSGKLDFGGSIISVSSRYWPGAGSGHGTMMASNMPGEAMTIITRPPNEKPMAVSSILLDLGPPDKNGTRGDYRTWRKKWFEGPTEEDVKLQVESWVQAQMADIVTLLGGEAGFPHER